MATVNIDTGPMVDDLGLIINVQSPRPPFNAGVGIHAKTYIKGTDFASGDDVIFNVKASPKVRYAAFSEPDGTVINPTIGSLSPLGTKYTLSSLATDVQVLIIFDV